jgi:hypothetical protein
MLAWCASGQRHCWGNVLPTPRAAWSWITRMLTWSSKPNWSSDSGVVATYWFVSCSSCSPVGVRPLAWKRTTGIEVLSIRYALSSSGPLLIRNCPPTKWDVMIETLFFFIARSITYRTSIAGAFQNLSYAMPKDMLEFLNISLVALA